MKQIIRGLLALIFATGTAFADDTKHSYVPEAGFVPDEITAIRIAKAIWIPIYGEKQIENEEPIRAELKGEVWYVKGSLPKIMPGGVAEAEINKKTGCILRVTHGK